MRLVLSTGVLDTERLLDVLPVVREAGFRELEVVDIGVLTDDLDLLGQLARRAQACGIEMPNWHLVQESPFQETAAASQAAVDRMKRSMDRGSTIGAKNHVLHWHHRFRDRGYDARWRDIVDQWADHAASLGIRLLMETVPDKPSNERYVCSSEISEFVRRYPPDVLSICIDVNHSNLQEELPDVVRVVGDRLVSLHVSDNDGHSEKHWLPGQGVIDYPSLIQSLGATRFDGLFVLEVNTWCADPHVPSEMKRLHDLGVSLMATGRPGSAARLTSVLGSVAPNTDGPPGGRTDR